mgnify:FL=1
MFMVYQDNTMYVDLVGDVDIDQVISELNKVNNNYKLKNIIVDTSEAFDISYYKKNKLKNLINVRINNWHF